MTSSEFPLPVPPAGAHTLVFRAAASDYVAIFVEGPGDVEVWKPWFRWIPVPRGGRIGVLTAVKEMRASPTGPFVGIIDADCDALEGSNDASTDVLVSESHDLECDLLRAGVLERLLATVDESAVAQLLKEGSLAEALLTRGLQFGYLRWLFFRRRVTYPKGRLAPSNFVHKSTWELDTDKLTSEAASILNEGASSLLAQIESLRQSNHDAWAICNGHDLINLLAIALRGPLGAKHKFPSQQTVHNGLCLAIDASHLAKLRIWSSLTEWEKLTNCRIRNIGL
jgi:hypothetical protein